MTVGETAARAELKAEADAAAVGKLTVPKLKEALLQRGLEATGLKVSLGDTRLEDGRVVGDLSIGGRS